MKNDKARIGFSKGATGTTLLLAIGLFATDATAQSFNQIAGAEKPVPLEYRPEPIRVNSFELSPYIDAEVELVDNIFAIAGSEINDTILSLTPGINIRDRRTDRQISVNLRGGYEDYLDNTISDRITFNGSADARFGLGTLTRTFFKASYRENGTQGGGFSNIGTIGRPIGLSSYGLGGGVERDIGRRFVATLQGNYNRTNYDGDFFFRDIRLNSSIRDFDVLSGQARLAYKLDSRQRVYVLGGYSARDFSDLTDNLNIPLNFRDNLSSDDTTLRVGYSRDLTELLQIDANIGLIDRDFAEPGKGNSGSLSYDARVLWSPTRLTDVQFRAARKVDINSDPLSAGLLRTEFAGTIQHELRKNIIWAADARYSVLDIDGRENNGDEIGTSTSLRYLLSKRWALRVKGEYFTRRDYFEGSQTRLTVGTRYNF